MMGKGRKNNISYCEKESDKMEVYLVQGHIDMEVYPGCFVEQEWVYGIFSSKEKANEIANNLMKIISECDEKEEIKITEMNMDEPTKDYHLMVD